MESISYWILSFKSSRVRGRCLKILSFRYPERKSHRGLSLVTMPATPRLALNRPNAQRTFPSTLGANVVLCEMWPHPVETTHLVSTSSILGRRKVSSISTYRSEVTVTIAPPSSINYTPITPRSASAHQRVTPGE